MLLLFVVFFLESVHGTENVFVQNFTSLEGVIATNSSAHERLGHTRCEFLLQTPRADPASAYDVLLNFTQMEGFYPHTDHGELLLCSAQVELWTVSRAVQSLSSVIARLCPDHTNYTGDFKMAHVFHVYKCSAVRVVYSWLPGAQQPSGFVLHYRFHRLQDPHEVLYGKGSDSVDQQSGDVSDCSSKAHSTSREAAVSSGAVHVSRELQLVSIVITVVLAIAFITCVVSCYRSRPRSWSDDRQLPSRTRAHDAAPSTSSVIYDPAEALAGEHALAAPQHTPPSRMEMQYPASIQLPDGEERPYGNCTYWQLHSAEQQSEILRQCIRPPPNRTIHDIKVLPPHRPHSLLLLPSHQQNNSPQLDKKGDKTPLVTAQHHKDEEATAQFRGVRRHAPLAYLEAPPPSYVRVVAASTTSESTRHPPPDV
ncbi:PREDICTED: uncharacterized protein LOC106815779 [Priapulus caudatus]|uniref:Uncharacterized protein LOC106815779 n=1 Tax=Priapulus caudatus TaxID=37621 RepID=A0ABM1EUA1_PRICU|nr:PREDICTED: uncharacterized protein LOC106815779 [Priapulus caudatus]